MNLVILKVAKLTSRDGCKFLYIEGEGKKKKDASGILSTPISSDLFMEGLSQMCMSRQHSFHYSVYLFPVHKS